MGPMDRSKDWLFSRADLENSASRKDGTYSSVEKEDLTRARCIHFLKEITELLQVKSMFIFSTATVYFHRFFLFHSFNQHDRFVVAAVCLILACKSEDASKSIERVVAAKMFAWERFRGSSLEPGGDRAGDPSGAKELLSDGASKPVPAAKGKSAMETFYVKTMKESKEAVLRAKDEFVAAERLLVHTLCFDLHVSHPHIAVADHLKKMKMRISDDAGFLRLKQEVYHTLMDSFRSTLCLKVEAVVIASAAVYMANLHLSLLPCAFDKDVFLREVLKADVTEDLLTSTCLELVRLYRFKMPWSNEGIAERSALDRLEAQLYAGCSPCTTATAFSPHAACLETSDDYPYGAALTSVRSVTVTKVAQTHPPRPAQTQPEGSPLSSSVESTPRPPPSPEPLDADSPRGGRPRADSDASDAPPPPPPPDCDTPRSQCKSMHAGGPLDAVVGFVAPRTRPRSDSGSSFASVDSAVPPPPPHSSSPRKKAPRIT